MPEFTHIDDKGRVRMVDVTDKDATLRTASAQGVIHMKPATLKMILAHEVKKGNVLETARIAGIMAAKRTCDLIPMCHPLHVTHLQVDFFPEEAEGSIGIETIARIFGRTGVEMEALTAAAVAALTIYDMCKSYDKEMVISNICLLTKTGGKSGTFTREKDA